MPNYITIPYSSDFSLDGKLENNITHNQSSLHATDTKTYYSDTVLDPLYLSYWENKRNDNSVKFFEDFIIAHQSLIYDCNLSEYYRHFKIPKSNGGYRDIYEPNNILKGALIEFRNILKNIMHATYHNSAYAYIKHRNILNCMECHQRNSSKWFAKFDIVDFFGNITIKYTQQNLKYINPLNIIMNRSVRCKLSFGCGHIKDAFNLCFLDKKLPQGSPVSPLISNIVMIPLDYEINRMLNTTLSNNGFVYTRYADDIIISSKDKFDYRDIENHIMDIFKYFNANFVINSAKTRFGSSSGKNWNLGLMLNKDNNITIGHEVKKVLKASLNTYIVSHLNGIRYSKCDAEKLSGLISYYKMVERDYINYIIDHYNKKYNVDIYMMLKKDINCN